MFASHAFLVTLPRVAGAIASVLLVTYVISRIIGKHKVVDVAWGLLFVSGSVAAFVGSSGHGNDARRWLLLALVTAWGVRLAVHIGLRGIGKPDDPRYEKLLEGRGQLYLIATVYLLQGVLAFVIGMPVFVGMFEGGGITALAFVGVAVWVVGVFFEAVGDLQMERFKADPNRGRVMDRGLWRYTRHPNYFGDSCVWVGMFLVAAESWPGVMTVFSPAVMVYLLVFGSGKRLLEKAMAQRPGYSEYMRRTSGFFPRPPKKA